MALKSASNGLNLLDQRIGVASLGPMKNPIRALLIIFISTLSFYGCTRSSKGGLGRVAQKSSFPLKEFVFNNGAEPETLDPHRITAANDGLLGINLFESLLSREADYVTLKPGLAESWKISKDGKVYTFVIRPHLKWSNGENMTIEQIRNSLIRALDPNVANQYVYWYTDYIKGAAALHKCFHSKNRAALEKKLGIQIIDGNKIQITLIKPASYFKYFLSQPPFAVIHPSMYSPDSPAWTQADKFISSGAFKLADWKVNERVVLERNPNLFDADKVFFDKVIAYPINEESTTLNMYNSGQLDWTGASNSISATLVPSLESRKDFYHIPILGTYMYEFNTLRKPFKDVRVRQALAMAVDRKNITDRVLRSGCIPTDRIIPPVVPHYKSVIPPESPLKERVKKANQLLDEAGYKDRSKFPSVTIMYNTTEGHHKVAQAIQQMWKDELGINVQLENMEWKVFLKEQQAKEFDISRKGWIGDYPDPTTFLEIFMSKSENNDSGWKNKAFDDLVNKGVVIQDDQKRYAVLAKAEKILYDEVPAFGIYHYTAYGLIKPNVVGFVPNVHTQYLFRYLSKK